MKLNSAPEFLINIVKDKRHLGLIIYYIRTILENLFYKT